MAPYFEYLIGGLFIILGFLAAKYPRFFPNYKAMPEEEFERIAASGYFNIARTIFIAIGLLLILGKFIMSMSGYASQVGIFSVSVIIIGVIILWIIQYRYTKMLVQVRLVRFPTWLTVAIIAAVIGFCLYAAKPARISLENDNLVIHGTYGLNLPTANITKVELRDELPKLIMRTNGLSLGKYQKGYSKYEELGNVILFLHSGKGPFLIIYSDTERPIIINRSSPEKTMDLYKELQ